MYHLIGRAFTLNGKKRRIFPEGLVERQIRSLPNSRTISINDKRWLRASSAQENNFNLSKKISVEYAWRRLRFHHFKCTRFKEAHTGRINLNVSKPPSKARTAAQAEFLRFPRFLRKYRRGKVARDELSEMIHAYLSLPPPPQCSTTRRNANPVR